MTLVNPSNKNETEPDIFSWDILNSDTLAKLFIMCLKKSCFPDCWKVSLVVPVFKNVVEGSAVKNYHLVNILSVVSKVSEKLVIGLLIHLHKFGFLPIFNMVLDLLNQLHIF